MVAATVFALLLIFLWAFRRAYKVSYMYDYSSMGVYHTYTGHIIDDDGCHTY